MWEFIKIYLITFIVFLVVEGIWLSLIAKNFYKKEIGFLMSKNPKILPTIIFSLVFVAGLVFFVIQPALAEDSWLYGVLVGGFFGLVTYATYDLTNHGIVENWPLKVTIVDLLWGMSMSVLDRKSVV